MIGKKICIFGLGYIGFPTAVLFANSGFDVLGVEKNSEVLDTLELGNVHIKEPELKKIALKVLKEKKLKHSSIAQNADVFIICVPTPIKYDENNKPDLNYVIAAVKEIIPLLKPGNLVILESTSPIGTVDMIDVMIKKSKKNIKIAYCPERVLPGNIIYEMINNNRIVGGINSESTKDAANVYREICKGKVLETDAKTAELCKLAENSYRDINIAFANELSLICDIEKISVSNLINLANKHPRVDILKPGIGVGGHCIPIDPWFIFSSYPNYSSLIQTARKINNAKTEWVYTKITEKINLLNVKNPKIACLGLSYKPDSDDMRESPALKIFDNLIKNGFEVVGVEPNLKVYKNYKLISLKHALAISDLIVILVGHKLFIDNSEIKSAKNIIDFCGIL
jgi:UDP-N-acetyl-D-mannosaminuronic acid dehydrogenase